MRIYALTTKDNPYDVFDDFVNWMRFDHQKGYFTSELLARIAKTSEELSEEEYQSEIERAIDDIIQMHPIPKASENDRKEEENNKIEEENDNNNSNSNSFIEYVKVSKEG